MFIKNSLCKLLLTLCLVFSLSLLKLCGSVIAFEDHFTSDPRLNPTWEIHNDSGIIFDDPGITLHSEDSNSYPYLKTNIDSEMSEDKYFEITFQYIQTNSPWGVGFSFTDNPPKYPTYLGEIEDYLNYNIFYTFGEKLHSVSTICPLGIENCGNTWWFIYPNKPPTTTYSPNTIADYNIHTYSIQRNDLEPGIYSYDVYLDSSKIFSSGLTERKINSLWIGHPSILDSNKYWPRIKLFSVKSAREVPHDFPYFSQLDSRWGTQEYDTASSWAGENNKGIDSWGCALTSAAMILDHYGVKAVDGTQVDPAKLNDWLKGEPDGYIGSGLINWLAITRFAKESYDAGQSDTKLEYQRSYLPTQPILPAIFGLPGHFIVAYDENESEWVIRDPANNSRSNLEKTTSLNSINRFIPSQTNLSYMLLTMPSFLEATITDSSDNTVLGDWLDESIKDSDSGESSPTVRTGMIPKPKSGTYRIQVNNPSAQQELVHFYFYDDIGVVTKTEKLVNPGRQTFTINYFSDDSGTSTVSEIDTTPPETPVVISPNNNSYVKANGLILDWSDVNDDSVVTYYYKSSWDGGSYGPVSTGSNSYINASGSADKTYTWQVQACDAHLNCSPWSSSVVNIDSTSPTPPEIVKPEEGEYFRHSPILNTWSTSTDQFGVDHYLVEYQYDDGHIFSGYPYRTTTTNSRYHSPSILEQGGVKYRVQAYDKAGNQSLWSDWRHYFYDETSPSIPIFNNLTGITNSSAQLWSWNPATDQGGSGISGYASRFYSLTDNILGEWGWIGNYLSTTTNLAEGKWQLDVKAIDNAGNESLLSRSQELEVDLTAPESPLTLSPGDGMVVNGNFLLSDWSDVDGAKSYIYESYHDSIGKSLRYRGEFAKSEKTATNVAESVFWWRVKAIDEAGNASPWSKLSKVIVDNTKPTLLSKTLFTNWYRTPQTSNFEFIDNNLPDNYPHPWCDISTEGRSQTCSLLSNVCDLAGNCNNLQLVSNPANLDFSKPLLAINIWGRTLSGTASDNLAGIKSVVIYLTKPGQSEEIVYPEGLNSWSYDIPNPALGHYRARIVAFDWAGNFSDEVFKDFDLNSANDERHDDLGHHQSGTTLAATDERKYEKDNSKNINRESGKIHSSPTASPKPSATPKYRNNNDRNGKVLGVKDDQPMKFNYLWLLLPITIITCLVAIMVRYIISREKR